MFQLNKPPSQPIEHSSTPLLQPFYSSLRKYLYSKFRAPVSAARLEFTILKNPLKNNRSWQVNGCLFFLPERSKKLNVIDGSIQSKEREIPEYIQLDGKSKSVKLVRVPKFAEVPFPVIMEPSLVIEYYSR